MSASEIKSALRELANEEFIEHSKRFFKTAKGEYGHGDRFLGIRVPVLREHARKYKSTPLSEVLKILRSPYHEERLLALIMLVQLYTKADSKQQQKIFDAYLANTRYINNWDLVDSSAHQIVGGHLLDRKRQLLSELAKSSDMWERRIAIIATLHFIKQQQFKDTLKIARMLLKDEEDLIHKAVGWMLREVGNRDRAVEIEFLDKYYQKMPRTMLRYAIEKFPEGQRKDYLEGAR